MSIALLKFYLKYDKTNERYENSDINGKIFYQDYSLVKCDSSDEKYKLEYESDTPIVKVENSCFKNGKLSVSNGTARVKSGRTLSVKFSPFMNIFNKPNYEIYYIDKGYNVAVVGSPNKDYLWILSRQVISKEQILELLEVANGFGFDTSDIKFDIWEK